MIFKATSLWTIIFLVHFFSSLCFCSLFDVKQIEFVSGKDLIKYFEVQEIWKVGIEEHNRFRYLHGVPPLQGDIQMHKEAQKHAYYLAKTNKVELSSNTKFGENLATSYATNKLDAVREVVKRWYNRILFYNFDNPDENRNRPSSGPFCSIIWKSTTCMGIGVARNKFENKWMIVVLYDPDANEKKFRENVPPPKFDYPNLPDLFT